MALIGSLVAVAIALTISSGFCDEPNQPHCESRFHTQMVVALVGMIPVLSALLAVFLRRDLLALACLVLAVLVYAAWGVAIDDATHQPGLP